MCGICGVVFHDRERIVPAALVESMTRVLHHRGPDDCGVWTKGRAGLGHARLSIIDLSPLGHQPMSNEDGTVWITLNGEIYNYLELRADLERRGHRFRSKTDTEVVIHLWEELGERAVQSLCGMFALAIWDERQQLLFLARDRFGKKPLFYAELEDRFLFGSEPKAILADPALKSAPNLEAIHYYLAYQSVPAPHSAFLGMKKLPPAHIARVVNGRATTRPYWHLDYGRQLAVSSPLSREHLCQEIVDRLRQAVRARLMSDVPLGALLSGGVDSSLVVALAQGEVTGRLKTFSIGFAEDDYDETRFARMVAERYQTDHHELVVRPDAAAIFPDLVWHYNEPFADSSAIPTYYLCKMARDHVTVVLTGDGGDENFAGYPRYDRVVDSSAAARVRHLLRLVKDRARSAWHLDGTLGDRVRTLIPPWPRDMRQQRYYESVTHFHEVYQRQFYSADFYRQTRAWPATAIIRRHYEDVSGPTLLDRTLAVDLRLYLPDTLMTKVDVAGMAHSLEARMPFLDHRFVEFCATIPSGLKLDAHGVSKAILKQACVPFLPHEVISRRKMGFGVPLDHWFRNDLKAFAYDTLLSARAAQRGYFRPDAVRALLDRHLSGTQGSWHYHLWNLLMLELWHQMFVDHSMPLPAAAHPGAS